MKLAKASFEQAVSLDPRMAEGYSALSELAVTLPPPNMDEAIRFAGEAVAIDPQNFGGQRMLARLFTIRSRINGGQLDATAAQKAISAWQEVAKLDPRNAEAWAFLSMFAERQKKTDEQVEALRKWVSSVPPVDVQFYSRVAGPEASLDPESASLKLASVLSGLGQKNEAATILSQLIADDSDNNEAIAMLVDVLESTEGETAAVAVTTLQQAVHSSPSNVSLVTMLANLQSRLGWYDQAKTTLERHIATVAKSDRPTASRLSLALADQHLSQEKFEEAIKTYESALAQRGVGSSAVSAEDREFTVFVLERLIRIHKIVDRPVQAKAIIDRARKLLGPSDPFPDRQLVALLQSTGKRVDALSLARSIRSAGSGDATMLRMEASILTDLGRVDEAVSLIKENKPAKPAPQPSAADPDVISISVPSTDRFSDLLFISGLYVRAGRPKDAIEAANQAHSAATGKERMQIARMAVATAQQAGGEFAAAEETLRSVLREMPANPVALNNLGYFLVERGERLHEAIEMIREALKIDPRNPSYLDSLGWAHFKSGKIGEAEKYLRQALAGDSDSPAILEHLGDLYEAKKDLPRARSYWTRAARNTMEGPALERLNKKLGK